MTRMQAGTYTNSTTSDAAMYGPGTMWHTMGSATITPAPPATDRELATVTKNADGTLYFSGSMDVMLEFFEQNPKFWLRLMALEAEEKNGEAENGDD